jgi:hypothetical protein
MTSRGASAELKTKLEALQAETALKETGLKALDEDAFVPLGGARNRAQGRRTHRHPY